MDDINDACMFEITYKAFYVREPDSIDTEIWLGFSESRVIEVFEAFSKRLVKSEIYSKPAEIQSVKYVGTAIYGVGEI